jgi:hypothetical protein
MYKMFALAEAFPFDVDELAEKNPWFHPTEIELPSTISAAPVAQPDSSRAEAAVAAINPLMRLVFIFLLLGLRD